MQRRRRLERTREQQQKLSAVEAWRPVQSPVDRNGRTSAGNSAGFPNASKSSSHTMELEAHRSPVELQARRDPIVASELDADHKQSFHEAPVRN